MLKKISIFLCVIIASHSAIASTSECNEPRKEEMSLLEAIAILTGTGIVITAAVVVIAPLVLPASTVAAAKATVAAVAAKATAAGASAKATAAVVIAKTSTASSAMQSAAIVAIPIINKATPYVNGVKMSLQIKEQVAPSTEQKLLQLLKEEALEEPFEEQLIKIRDQI